MSFTSLFFKTLISPLPTTNPLPPQWVDEDEQNEAPEDDYMNNFGGQGMGEDGGFGGIDFSKLGAGGGMPGMGGDEGEDEEEEDDEMPGLENEGEDEEADSKGKEKAGEAAPKIEEVA
jgi:hypothetical protein